MFSCLWAYRASSPAATAGAEGVVSIPVDLLESCKACLPQVPGEQVSWGWVMGRPGLGCRVSTKDAHLHLWAWLASGARLSLRQGMRLEVVLEG